MQLINDVLKDPLKYAEYAGIFLGSLLAVVKAFHALLLAIELVAKLTPTKADDDALRAVDVWVLKAEAWVIWLQQKLLMMRGPKAAVRAYSVPVNTPDQSNTPTEPGRPRKS
jgi:hypothetical protein